MKIKNQRLIKGKGKERNEDKKPTIKLLKSALNIQKLRLLSFR